ncbi:hypothetical protein PsorP6_010395 [Peronosclerospora sorghi]|uniref:Uncharacterized protein n=1 Tax=Peronosclerospora sorghi TaxID=230839 RepID=A0ACC0VUI6_9STRA|nr:hypothetical protein PsorP6_010395 [Peronosclerospora sorghi]
MCPLRSVLLSGVLTRQECDAVFCVCRSWRATASAILLGSHSLLLSSDICLLHRLPGRVERPERLQVVSRRLRAKFPSLLTEMALPPATDAQLQRVHGEVYVDMVTRMSKKVERSMVALDTAQGKGKAAYYEQYEFMDLGDDMTLMQHTLAAARVAAGGACLAVDRVLSTKYPTCNAFCAVRPPGHHAERCRAMGFCVFNNVAVAALHALEAHGLARVAIVDIDVHHGNGTQDIAAKEPRLLYVSMHQAAPCFPRSGFASDKGMYDNILNIPLRAKCTARTYRQHFATTVVPRVRAFKPQLILVSMGFDGSSRDPLGELRLEARDFYWITSELCKVAWECCHGKLVSVMEGGYHLGALADGAEQHVRALLHGSCSPTGVEDVAISN